jgi:hypothetical protein
MKITVTKIDAAKFQLATAINLFFEQKDPISIHTLTSAALQILHDHFPNKDAVWDNNLMLHYHSIYVKDGCQKEWRIITQEPANFFKHANSDLKNELKFNTEITTFHIFEAIRCLRIIEGEEFQFSPEFKVYFSWFILNYPNLIKDKDMQQFLTIENPPDHNNLEQFRIVLSLLKQSNSTIKI